jgi:hypothetical protein
VVILSLCGFYFYIYVFLSGRILFIGFPWNPGGDIGTKDIMSFKQLRINLRS